MEVYLDNSATTKVCAAACEAAVSAMKTVYGNPSSLHRLGFEAEKLVTQSRKQIAGALSCSPDELYFTSGATESNNLAIRGLTAAYPRIGRKIVTTTIEHPSVSETVESLCSTGYEVIKISPDSDGNFSPDAFAEAVDENTALVTFMLVNNEVGVLLPAAEICKAVKRKNPNTLIHIDAVQGFCKVPFRSDRILADTISISGHKIYAPKGVGGLYLKKGVRLKPAQTGGGQEKGLRSGTESVPLIAAFGAAVAETYPNMENNQTHYRQLREHLKKRLMNQPEIVMNSPENAVPYICNFSVRGIRSEIMLHFLEQSGIYVSSGSACAKGKPSPVLAAMGIPKERADSALRISFSPETTISDIDLLLDGLNNGISSLQKMR
ncbi:MAG: cysteine desulfurase family protein [Clostridiales bacterium]|nr:cysteine desulfurase family protein [Clostridiales bacterium]